MKAAFTPGTTFANYRVESLLGRGGMGVVYLARDLSLDRPVALKLIAPELADDEQFRARFLREPRLAASLDHHNVIPIYEAGEHEGQLYLAMRYVEGSDLRTLLDRDGRLSPERTLGILSQVAGALDAAHRRALVHRDLKPANVLLDEDDHAYLTDFGITKQLGGASTDTGRLVGTLDYLAPEQIRGEPVDARTDSYALGCVLYECLAGKPPFRRDSEAATMWAHMQDEPPPLRGHARFDAVLRKALAKDRENRYATCGELIEAAAAALGLEVPTARPRPRVPEALYRRAPAMVAVGGVVLAAAVGLAILAMTGGDDGDAEALGNGIAALDPASGNVGSFVDSATPPGNVAVGEGAVWVLNNERETVSRIDPQTKQVTKRFRTQGVPSELAVGEGALWVGRAGGEDVTNATVSVSRMDPKTGRVTRTVRLRGDQGSFPVAGVPRIAVGAGAVWAANPDGNISRIDPDTGRLDATIETGGGAWTIAAGDEGVWFLEPEQGGVGKIDPRTNRVTRTIPVGADDLVSIAVGAGSVWAGTRIEGVVWRIIPGRPPDMRTIDVGAGVGFVSFGEGALWAASYADGVVSRIDPRTNEVTARTSVGAPQAIAAGVGSAWVSVAGGTTAGSLEVSACGPVVGGGGDPDVLIASDLPLQGPDSAGPRALEGAIRFMLEQRRFRAGEFSVGYQSCDVSTPQSGGFEFRKCAANASAFAHAEKLVAVIGPWSSFCGQVQIPILNRAPGGPPAIVSPTATHPGFTRGGRLAEEPSGLREEPGMYYPTGVRNFFRVVPRDDLQGVAQALMAQRLGLRRVFVVTERGSFFKKTYADPFSRAATRLGLDVVGSAGYDAEARGHARLAERVADARPDGILLGGWWFEGGDRVLRALRERLGPRVVIMATQGFLPIPEMLEQVGPAARGLYVTAEDVPAAAREPSPASLRFARDFGQRSSAEPFVLTAAQATDVVMRAIGRSDGTRESVLEEIRSGAVKNGLLGDFRFERGDITPAMVPVFRVTGRTPASEKGFDLFDGAVVDHVFEIPAGLSG
jgi:ABC-type branched-subunit amino acid transport system substrate-binding protein/streptogramin lyase/predicted Ser/Thr protein kinase